MYLDQKGFKTVPVIIVQNSMILKSAWELYEFISISKRKIHFIRIFHRVQI